MPSVLITSGFGVYRQNWHRYGGRLYCVWYRPLFRILHVASSLMRRTCRLADPWGGMWWWGWVSPDPRRKS